jgi:hypothetical protein
VLSDRIVYTLFNWDDSPKDVSVTLPGKGRLKDVWTDKDMGKHEGRFNCKQMPPHSARLLEFRQK